MKTKQVILITGCSKGFGLETSIVLAQKGHRVFSSMRNLKKQDKLRELSQGLPVYPLEIDVDKPSSIKKGVQYVLKQTGKIDVLVNNAGLGSWGPLEEFNDQEMHHQFETNVFGLLRMTRAVLPVMRQQKQGRILNIGSLAGRIAVPGMGLYCASKYAVRALTNVLRIETQSFGIQVTVIEPGPFKTNFVENQIIPQTELKACYQTLMKKLNALNKNRFRSSATIVGLKIAEIIESSKPMKICYPVGREAHIFSLLEKILPQGFFYQRMASFFRRTAVSD